MVLACLTTEAVLQARLLPAQERRNGHFAKPDICRARVGGCPVQSSALLVSRIPKNNPFPIESNIYFLVFDGACLSDN